MLLVCRLVGLQVVHHDGSGGESLLVDGFHAGENIRKRLPEAFDCLTKTSVPHQYIQNGLDVKYSAEILKVNPITKELMHIRLVLLYYAHYLLSSLVYLSIERRHALVRVG